MIVDGEGLDAEGLGAKAMARPIGRNRSVPSSSRTARRAAAARGRATTKPAGRRTPAWPWHGPPTPAGGRRRTRRSAPRVRRRWPPRCPVTTPRSRPGRDRHRERARGGTAAQGLRRGRISTTPRRRRRRFRRRRRSNSLLPRAIRRSHDGRRGAAADLRLFGRLADQEDLHRRPPGRRPAAAARRMDRTAASVTGAGFPARPAS